MAKKDRYSASKTCVYNLCYNLICYKKRISTDTIIRYIDNQKYH